MFSMLGPSRHASPPCQVEPDDQISPSIDTTDNVSAVRDSMALALSVSGHSEDRGSAAAHDRGADRSS